jgi:plastocyanin
MRVPEALGGDTLQVGKYHFQCDPHAALGMKGKLEVEAKE